MAVLRDIGSIVVVITRLVVQAPLVIPKVLLMKRKAIRTFAQKLRQAGLNEHAVAILTDRYAEIGDVSDWVNHAKIEKRDSRRP